MSGPSSARSLTWQLLIWMAAIGLGPLLVVSVLGYRDAESAIRELGDRYLRSVLASRKARLERWRVEVASDFSFLAVAPCTVGACNRPPDDGTPLGAACCDFLKNICQHDRIYRTIASFDERWRRVSDTAATPSIDAAELPDAFKAALGSSVGLVVSEARRRERAAEAFAGHAIVQHGRTVGWVVARPDLASVIRPILADSDGLGASGRARLLLAGDTDPATALEVGGPPAEFRDGDATRLGVATAVDGLGRLVVDVDPDEAFELVETLGNRARRTGLLTLAAIVVLAFIGARRLSRPQRDLADASRRIAAGERDRRVEPRGTAEDRDVATAFNAMLDELDAAEARVRRQASLAAVGSLSTSIVHEMRNPLASIKLNLGPLAARAADDPAHAELAAIATEQVARLEGMLDDLLHYGRPLEPTPVALRFSDLVDDVLIDLRGELDARGIAPAIDDRLGDRALHADPELMRRVLGNLVENALAAVGPGGRIEIAARATASGVELAVRDDGPGIPAANRDRIFEPFFTTRDGGTGLGLANVKKIVEYHGGRVVAEDTPGGGTRFVITLPGAP